MHNRESFAVCGILSIMCFGEVYCDVITRSHLQFINTSIDTFFSKLCAFLTEQRRTRKVDDEVDESSADQEIRKSDAIVHTVTCKKSGGLHLAERVLQ